MAHYDCKDCGYGFGIAYGYCDNCTHQSVMKAKQQLERKQKDAQLAWDKKVADERSKFIADFTAEARASYHALYNNFKPKGVSPL